MDSFLGIAEALRVACAGVGIEPREPFDQRSQSLTLFDTTPVLQFLQAALGTFEQGTDPNPLRLFALSPDGSVSEYFVQSRFCRVGA